MTRFHYCSPTIENLHNMSEVFYAAMNELDTAQEPTAANLAKWFSGGAVFEAEATGISPMWCRDSANTSYYIPPKSAVVVTRYPISWTAEQRATRTPEKTFYVYSAEALENLSFCDVCGNIEVETHYNMRRTSDGLNVCPTCCRDHHYSVCGKCGCWFPSPERHTYMTALNGVRTVLCPDCAEAVHEDTEHYSRCDVHNAYFMRGVVNLLGEVDACPSCFREYVDRESRGIRVRGYHFRPTLHFSHPRSRERRLHVGIEYEYSGLDCDDAEMMLKIAYVATGGKVYGQEDGSVSVEICTHPLTLDEHFPVAEVMETLADRFDATGYNAGCHMHLDIRYLGETDRERLMNRYKLAIVFDKFSPQLLERSLREDTHYCGRSQALEYIRNLGYGFPLETDEQRLNVARRLCRSERYQTVNNQNSETVEIRLPAQTCSASYIKAWLVFLESLTDWCKETPAEAIECATWQTVTEALPCGDVLKREAV